MTAEAQFVDAYRANIAEARAELARAQERFGRLRDAGLIYHGKITLKSGSEYEGWLVKGADADAAFTARARAGSNLMHWLRLLAEATSAPAPEAAAKSTAMPTEEEKRAFVERWKAEMDARAEVAPAPPAEQDQRLPPERDDDIDF